MSDTDVRDPQAGTVIDLDEMEATFGQPEVDPAAPAVPEEFKNLSPADVAAQLKAAQEALKLTGTKLEEANMRAIAAQEAAKTAARPVIAAPPQAAPDPLDSITEDQIEELYASGDPVKMKQARAIEREINNRRLMAAAEARFGGIASSAAQVAEAQVRAKFAEAFDLFGTEIMGLMQTVSPQNRANPAAWETIIASVQGHPANIDKLIAHRTKKAADASLAAAQASAAAAAPMSPGVTAPRREAPAAPAVSAGLDRDAQDIAEVQFPIGSMTYWGTKITSKADAHAAYARFQKGV